MTELEFKMYLDQKLYEIASVMMAYYNCCSINGSSCKAGNPNPCCEHTLYGSPCPFMINGKCRYDNSQCAIWLCETAIRSTDPVCIEGLKLLEQFGNLYGLVRPPLIGHPYSQARSNHD